MKTKLFFALLAVVLFVPVSVALAGKVPAPTVTGITVTSPNGGEVYTVGNKITITWKAASSISTVNLGYSSGPGNLSWIATSVPNTGSYAWTVSVGNTSNTKFLIDISGYSIVRNKSTYYHDQSNNYFTVNPAPAPTLSLIADNTDVLAGGSTILRWSSTNATSCTASGAWSGSKALNGAYDTGAIANSQGYYLSCSGLGGTIEKGVVVYVVLPPPPTVNLSADSTSIAYGASTILRWSSTGATSCTAYGDWTGAQATSGSYATGALTQSSTYYLSCTGDGGTTVKSVGVTVAPNPVPTVSMTSSGNNLVYGGTTQLQWSSTGATSCTASGDWSGAKATSGTFDTGRLFYTKTYSLTCTGAGGSAVASVTVTVLPPVGPAPVLSFTADSLTIANRSETTLRWSTTDATTCTADGAWTGTQSTSGAFATGKLFADRYYTLYCEGPGGFSNYATLVISVFGVVNQQPNTWTLQQAVDSGLGLNCPSEMYEDGKGPNGIERYYFADGKVRRQSEEFQLDGTLQKTYIDIFYPGVALYEGYGEEVPLVIDHIYYPGSLGYDYFASNMNTRTLTGYRCNEETIDPSLLTPVL